MRYHTRKLVKSEDLNGRNTLFGGRLLEWIDEECYIYSCCQLGTTHIVTKYMSEINFINPGFLGDVIEIGVETVNIGRTSLTLHSSVRNKMSKDILIDIETIVFVALDEEGRPSPHRLSGYAGKKEFIKQLVD
ncbi:acyl-CoA thioesterase [Candidatus Endobugula sertula]|uniref:Acyl-CoA thioesterase n=1 Tax=Candidatus Endobugula sertula TaxID=62101 RepID=A0A1D2QNQ6_9GAMM|nr:acyl-CoA thioesterase [Candidatus Endobugula sertula]